MRTNLVRGFKKAVCVFALGTGLALTGITVHATDKVVSTEQAATEVKSTGEWVKDKGETYYKDASGQKVRSKFVEINKKTYYFGKNGAMEKGWVKVGKKYYYLDRQTGVLKTKGKVGGYSDMAIGLGHMFGFHFKENFQYPYGADSIQEFWRRWHISLSTWFKEYLYIPLGGNRKGTARTCINRIIVFFFTGLWHGANWTFVIWGLWHGMFLLFETYCPIVKKAPKVIARIYTLLVVCVGFVMFRADTLTEGLFMIRQMFTGFSMDPASMSFAVQQLTPWFLVMLAAGIIGAAPIRKLVDHIRENVQPEVLAGKWKTVQIVLYVVSAVLLIWCMIRLSGSTYNPFIYFRF